jgi:hypothetical protein
MASDKDRHCTSVHGNSVVTVPGSLKVGGPLKPSFGLSGVVLPLDRACLPLVPAFSQPTRIQSLPVLHSRLRTAENCSTPTLSHSHTTRVSPGCDGCSEAFRQTACDSGCRNRSSAFAKSAPPRQSSAVNNGRRWQQLKVTKVGRAGLVKSLQSPRDEASLRRANSPTQAKTGLEWATRPRPVVE